MNLDIHRVVGVGSAVQDVEHGNREHRGTGATDVGVEGELHGFGSRLGHRQRDTQDGVGSETALVLRAIELDEGTIHHRLVPGVHAQESGTMCSSIFSMALRTLLAVISLVAISKLQSLS